MWATISWPDVATSWQVTEHDTQLVFTLGFLYGLKKQDTTWGAFQLLIYTRLRGM